MSKISECLKLGAAERIAFDDQDVDTDWAYLRLGYENDHVSSPQKFNWFKARTNPFGFDLVLDDRQLEAIYQERLKEQQA